MVIRAVLAPLACVEPIDRDTCTDEVGGLDDAPVIDLAPPELMQALALGLKGFSNRLVADRSADPAKRLSP